MQKNLCYFIFKMRKNNGKKNSAGHLCCLKFENLNLEFFCNLVLEIWNLYLYLFEIWYLVLEI